MHPHDAPGDGVPGRAAAAVEKLDRVVIRIAGDSGDGMPLAGDRFTAGAAVFGNDLATQPNFPAEIRAPRARCPASPASGCRSRTTTC